MGRRSLSPGTRSGIATLRSTLLTADDKIQWSRLLEMVEEATVKEDSGEMAPLSTEPPLNECDPSKQDSTETAKNAAMKDAVLTLLGSPEGAVLRKLLLDLDSIDLISRLLSKDGKILRKQAVLAISRQ